MDKHHYSLWGSILSYKIVNVLHNLVSQLWQGSCKVVDSIQPCYKVVIDRAGANGLAGQVLA